MINIKAGGITSAKQLQQLEGLNISFADLYFSEQSPLYAGIKIKPADIKGLDLDLRKVGIFEEDDFDDIMSIADKFELDIIQLGAGADPELCADLSEDFEVIKSFVIDGTTGSVDKLVKDFDDACDYYLFESAADQKFDWKKITDSKIEKPFFISGGIEPEDAALVKKFKHPDFYGISLGKAFQKEPGVVDMVLLLRFMQDLK